MAFKVMLDANIVLDFTLQRDIGYKDAKELVAKVIEGRLSAFVTPFIVHIAGYYLRKIHGIVITKQMLFSFLSDVRAVDIPHTVVLQSLQSAIPDVEDGLQYYSALHHHLDYFISRDKPLLKHALPQLPVVSPRVFLEKIL